MYLTHLRGRMEGEIASIAPAAGLGTIGHLPCAFTQVGRWWGKGLLFLAIVGSYLPAPIALTATAHPLPFPV